MARNDEYRARIAEYDWAALLDLWEAVKARKTPGWENGKAFEYLVIRAFEIEGADVRWPYEVRLGPFDSRPTEDVVEEIDGVVYAEGLACLLESKDRAESLNIEPVAKLRNQLLRRPAGTIGVVFSRSDFTRPARKLSQMIAPQAILLWNGREVEYALKQRCFHRALRMKYRMLVEEGVPDFDITSEAEQ
jgi:hypothetical protein